MDHKKDFVLASFEDIRDTIRAIDNKLNFLIAVLVIPLTVFPSIYSEVVIIYQKSNLGYCTVKLLIPFAILFWLTSLRNVILGLDSITDPGKFISSGREDNYKGSGTFYCYDPESTNILTQSSKYPATEDQFIFDLACEQLKLAKIRNVKIGFQKKAYQCFQFFIALSSLIIIICFTLSI